MAKNDSNDGPDLHGGRMRVPRSRGALGGLLLLLLGIWGALIPFIGPYVHFGYSPDAAWHLSSGRFWLELLPGIAAALGGLLLLTGANRVTTSLGGWLAAAGGAWFIVGPTLRSLLHLGSIGKPIHTSTLGSTLETLLLFSGLGALILLLAALALGRLSIVSVRDVRAAQRREQQNDRDDDTLDRLPRHESAVVPARPVGSTPTYSPAQHTQVVDEVDRQPTTAATEPADEERARPNRGRRSGATRADI